MRLVSLNCNQCGAPLEVPEKVQFLTCGYCSARLNKAEAYQHSRQIYEARRKSLLHDIRNKKGPS